MAEVNYATNGKGNLAVALGAVGTGLSVLNESGILSNLGGGNGENKNVTRYEMAMSQENAILHAKLETVEKMNELSKDFSNQIQAVKDAQAAINQEQATYNVANTAAVSVIQSQVQQLMGMTKLVIPNASVNPGWGPVTVYPEDIIAAAKSSATTASGN